MTEIIRNLRSKLSQVIKNNPYKGLLFSGGLDTSILASISPEVAGITVSLESGGEDAPYAHALARHFKLKHYHRRVEIDEAIEAIPEVIKILKSFDPALPNDLVVYFGLKFAKDLGLDRVATGDGSDELFAGYSYMKDIDDLEGYIEKIAEKMSFSSNVIGKFLEIKIIQPFIDKNIIDFALQIPIDLKIRVHNCKIYGKWILRRSFEDLLPKKIVWQNKRPLEYGSAMFRLRKIISDKVSDEEFRKNSTSIKFISKEHFYYYKIYRKFVGEIPQPKKNEKVCSGCGAGIKQDSFHCRICGFTMNWRQS